MTDGRHIIIYIFGYKINHQMIVRLTKTQNLTTMTGEWQ